MQDHKKSHMPLKTLLFQSVTYKALNYLSDSNGKNTGKLKSEACRLQSNDSNLAPTRYPLDGPLARKSIGCWCIVHFRSSNPSNIFSVFS